MATKISELSAASTLDGTEVSAVVQSGATVKQTNEQIRDYVLWREGADLASAGTTDIWATDDGHTVHITGTTTITSFGTAPQAGANRWIIFDGALQLTHGANLSLPGSANYTTAAGDMAYVYADTTTQFDVLIFKKDGSAISASGVITTRGDIIRGDSGGSAERLALGSAGEALVSDGTDIAYSGVREQGKETVWVPAGAMRPTVSSGCAALTDVETTAGRPDISVLDFDASVDEHAQFSVAFPNSWNEGTVTFQAFWTSTAIDTDGVSWGLQGVAVSDGDTIDVAYGTAVVVDDANQSTAEDLYVSAESTAVTIAGTPAAGDLCYFRVFRDVSDANDTATEDARLIGVKVFFTTNASTDA